VSACGQFQTDPEQNTTSPVWNTLLQVNSTHIRTRERERENLDVPQLTLSLTHTHAYTHTYSNTRANTHTLSLSLSYTHTRTLAVSLLRAKLYGFDSSRGSRCRRPRFIARCVCVSVPLRVPLWDFGGGGGGEGGG
jgi:hypothetical protein